MLAPVERLKVLPQLLSGVDNQLLGEKPLLSEVLKLASNLFLPHVDPTEKVRQWMKILTLGLKSRSRISFLAVGRCSLLDGRLQRTQACL